MTDLLGEIKDETRKGPGEVVDLLDGIGEDVPAWRPEEGEGVQGTVYSRSFTTSKFTPEPIPVIGLELDGGDRVRVIGFQTTLRNEINDADPQIGDLFAAKYFGRKDNKAGTGSYHHYKVAKKAGAGRTASSAPPF